MAAFVKRETLHQIIDDLSEPQLLTVAKFVEFLLSSDQQNESHFDLWALTEEDRSDRPADLDDLNEIIETIKNTPPNEQAITFPAKTWAEYAVEMPQEEDIALDIVAWHQTWDALEAEMEVSSLAHEEFERQEPEA